MNEVGIIESALEKAARRQRVSRALRGMWVGLFAASILWLLAIVLYKVFPLSPGILGYAGGIGLVCLLVGAVLGGWRKPSLVQTARWVDMKQNLKERLSTALEVAQTPANAEWQRLLVHDAAEHAHGLDPRRLLPLHLPKIVRWAVIILAVGAGLGFVPEYRSKEFKQKQADAVAIKETGKQLADVTKRSLETKPPTLEPTIKAMEKVEELGQHLAKVSLTKADALKDISSVREKLEKEAKELAKEPALKSLEKAARESSTSSGSQSAESMQKQIDALQKSLGASGNDPAKLDKMKQDLAKAQQMAANLPDKNSPEGKAAREQLSQMLSSLNQQMREAGAPAESLEQALKALQEGKIDQFVKDMNVTAEDLQKLSEMAKQMQSLQQQQAGAQAGKDLAEQLKKGQTDAAQQTLRKMIDQLKNNQLSKEQLDKILDEVAKAVDPAGEYGKVAEHLKNAAKQMQQCQKPGTSDPQKQQSKESAAQSLADAAKELDKLAQQMADAQQLSETMAMLERAQEAIATGKGWGQCNKPGVCSACGGKGCAECKGTGWGKGGGLKPGGVGTWTDDTGWTYYPKNVPQTPVDNSGVKRPDMDGRGLTERDAELNESLRPTKVKGQMAPGGQMPSVTLKGVSIKGQSKVQFEESAAAAQAEAQSAINQDQVPRAYRGAVKEYFNDLKK